MQNNLYLLSGINFVWEFFPKVIASKFPTAYSWIKEIYWTKPFLQHQSKYKT